MSSKRNRLVAQIAHDKRLAQRGCTLDQYIYLRNLGKTGPVKPLLAFNRQCNAAKHRGVEWKLSIWEWWTIWQESGHWTERGRGQGYVMCRKGDVGPYAVGNVFIAKNAENTSEGNRRKEDLPIGVHRSRNGQRFFVRREIAGRRLNLGVYDDIETAAEAYRSAGA